MSDADKRMRRRALGQYPWVLQDALEAELEILRVRLKRARLVDQINAIPSAALRARLFRQLATREAALIPDPNMRRRLLDERRPPSPGNHDTKE